MQSPLEDRRVWSRYDAETDCEVRFLVDGQLEAEVGRVADVSMEGFRLFTPHDHAVGSIVLLLPQVPSALPVYAEVMWCETQPDDGYAVGLRLIEGKLDFATFSRIAIPVDENPVPECFRLLGLELPCTLEEVESTYQERARQAHPEQGGEAGRFVELRRAYEDARSFLGDQSTNQALT